MKRFLFSLILFNCVNLTAQFPNVMVNNPSSTDPEEVAIAINITNPNFLAAGANISYFYSSTNAGSTWIQKRLTSSLGVWGDPCLLYDHNGYLYFAHLSNPLQGYWIDRIVVQRSTDNGVTWNDGAGIGLRSPKNQDKEWLAVDMHSPQYKGNLYVSWTEFDNYGSSSATDSSRILFSKSTDKGLTWSTPAWVSDRSGDCIDEDNTVEGAVPAIGINGEVYISWAGPLGLMFDKSTNGGQSFGTDIFISTMPGGWDQTVPGIYRANGLPITACDTSRSAYRGYIYCCWSDQRNGTTNTDIFVARSVNGGTTWQTPVKVNTDNSDRHQFFPWMTIDQTTGFLYVVFYDRRGTTGNATDVYVARSTDGGSSFTDFKVSASSFTPNSNIFFGDYSNIAAYNRKIYPLWMRLDNSTLSVYTAPLTDTTQIIPVEFISFSGNVGPKGVQLTWNTATELNCREFVIERAHANEIIGNAGIGDWQVIGSIRGAGTTTIPQSYSYTDEHVSPSEYYYRLRQIDYDGSVHYSDQLYISVQQSEHVKVYQNFPNPVKSITTFSFRLVSQNITQLKVFNQVGAEVFEKNYGLLQPGLHELDADLRKLSAGIYYYRIESGEKSVIKKLAVVK